ncbi:hypothetical protein HU200_060860 [Digitaria exilis]|uniref:Protein yippee-like n=1 Tax=Digitaria exilis TaxID=1010633 RepID=A0A835ADM0_9POAL|nr:hypothetical protein HU200_060860 [Digitaria exilis]CAB3462763.1 unnamed protein product [Digitaria exilis]
MGRLLVVSLPATGAVVYRCKHCDTHLAYGTDIMSRTFCCKHGTAYLFSKIVNVNVGEKEDRRMTTGDHTVCDIFCVACGSILGWKYLAAVSKSQRYKEGKFILDMSKASTMAAVSVVWPHAAADQQQQQQSDDEEDSSSSDHQDPMSD